MEPVIDLAAVGKRIVEGDAIFPTNAIMGPNDQVTRLKLDMYIDPVQVAKLHAMAQAKIKVRVVIYVEGDLDAAGGQ